MNPPYAIPDDIVLDAVDAALANGDRLYLCGGVRPRHVARHCDLKELSLQDRLLALARHGELVKVWGADLEMDGFPARKGYLPADHPDATAPFCLR